MIIEEFLIALGVKADTAKLKGFSDGLAKVGTIAVAAASSLKALTIGAWAFLDSTIDRVEELQKAENEQIRTTKEQVEMAKKYRENMDKMGKTIETVKTRIALAFLPAMYEMSKQYGKLLDDNKELIENGIKKLLTIMTKASQVLTNFFKFINLVITGTVGWKNALLILVGVLAWVKRAMILAFITNPITWVVAAIAGLLLLIDDFMTYLDGGESEFGEFWGSMLGWIDKNKDAISSILEGFKTFGSGVLYVLSQLGAAITDFAVGMIAAWNFFVGIFSGDMDLIKQSWSVMVEALLSMFANLAILLQPIADWLTNVFSAAWDAIVASVASAMETVAKTFGQAWDDTVSSLKTAISNMLKSISSFVNGIGAALSGVYNAVTAPFKAAFDWIANKFAELPSMISKATSLMTFGLSDKAASAVSNIRNRITNNTTSVNASINVNGTTSPQATAKAVGANLNSMTKSNVGGAAVA